MFFKSLTGISRTLCFIPGIPILWCQTGLRFFLSSHKGVSKNNGTPKSSILIGFSIIFTIHFGGFSHYFWFNTHIRLMFFQTFHRYRWELVEFSGAINSHNIATLRCLSPTVKSHSPTHVGIVTRFSVLNPGLFLIQTLNFQELSKNTSCFLRISSRCYFLAGFGWSKCQISLLCLE